MLNADKPRRGQTLPRTTKKLAEQHQQQHCEASTEYTAFLQHLAGVALDLSRRLRRWTTAPQGRQGETDLNIQVELALEGTVLHGQRRDITPTDARDAARAARELLDQAGHLDVPKITTQQDSQTALVSAQDVQDVHAAILSRHKEAIATRRADLAVFARNQFLPKNDPTTKKLFQAVRAGRVLLPTTMYDERQQGFTSSVTRIAELIGEAWEPILNRHRANPPSWNRFQGKYGKHFLNWCPAPERIPDGKDLHKQAKCAKEASSAGLDGRRLAELRVLHLAAWEVRAEVLALAVLLRQFSSPYRDVPTPSIPKKEDSVKPLDQRLLTIFSGIYRVEVGAWYRILAPWFF